MSNAKKAIVSSHKSETMATTNSTAADIEELKIYVKFAKEAAVRASVALAEAQRNHEGAQQAAREAEARLKDAEARLASTSVAKFDGAVNASIQRDSNTELGLGNVDGGDNSDVDAYFESTDDDFSRNDGNVKRRAVSTGETDENNTKKQRKKPRRSERTIFSLESSGYVPSSKKAKKSVMKKGNQKPAAMEATDRTPAKKSKAATVKRLSVSEHEEMDNKETRSPIKVKSVVVNNDSPNVSPLKYSQDDGESSVSVASRLYKVPLIDKTASWGVVWQDMKDGGWGYKAGDKLVSYYYVHPTFTHLTKAEMLEQCKEGVDYFKSEEALKKYVAKEYGWEGEVNSPLSTMPVDIDIGERIKAKPRGQKADKRSSQEKHVVASEVQVNQTASKKAAKIGSGSPRGSADVAFEDF